MGEQIGKRSGRVNVGRREGENKREEREGRGTY